MKSYDNTLRRHRGKVLTGLLIMAAGILLLLSNFNMVDIGPVWRYWPLILIALGVDKIFTAGTMKERGEGIWLSFIGSWLLVSFLHIFGLTFATSWPILIIGFGIGMIWKAMLRSRQSSIETEYGHEN